MMCRTYEIPGGTLEQDDEVSKHLGSETPDGAHLYIAVKTDDGFRVIEVWDSAEHDERYMQAGLGVPEPKVTDLEVHNLDWVS